MNEKPKVSNNASLGVIALTLVAIVLAVLLHSIVNSSTVNAVPKQETPKYTVRILNDSIVYDGDISDDGVRDAMTMYVTAQKTAIKYLVLRSRGGDIDAGIKLQNFVVQKNLVVFVSGYCYSACTLSFFAAKEKDMEQSAHIGIHNLSINTEDPGSAMTMDEVQKLTHIIAEKSAYVTLLYVKAGLPVPVLEEASSSFGKNMVSLSRADLVKYKVLPETANYSNSQ